jgi:hypothetical protein
MILLQPYNNHLSGSQEVHASFPIPMIYEHAPEPAWEYHVLTIDTATESLPAAEQLNELGHEGWILVSVLDERNSGKGQYVHYYFSRQSHGEAK